MATFKLNRGDPVLDRALLPRFPDGVLWYPHGCGPETPEAELVDELRGAWGTPGWSLDIGADVLRRAWREPPSPLSSPMCPWVFDPANRPGSESDRRILAVGGGSCYGVAKGESAHQGPDQDGLAHPWAARVRELVARMDAARRMAQHGTPLAVWNNPPWSKPKPWAHRAVEAANAGLWVQILVPHTTGGWWADLWGAAAYVTCLRKVPCELCPGLSGCATAAPTHQVSLITLCPPGVRDLPEIPDYTHPDGGPIVTLYGPRWAASLRSRATLPAPGTARAVALGGALPLTASRHEDEWGGPRLVLGLPDGSDRM